MREPARTKYPRDHNGKARLAEDDPIVQRIRDLRDDGVSLEEIAQMVEYPGDVCIQIIVGTYTFYEGDAEDKGGVNS